MKITDGLYARHYPSGKRALRVEFMYRGARNRETLKGLDPDNKTHVKMAIHRIGAIREAIRLDTFDYREFFPDSPRGRFFGSPRSRTVKQVGDSWLADMKNKPHSTYRSYAGPMLRFVYAGLGDGRMKVSDVTPEHIRDLFRSANITLKTARNYSIPLSGLLERALGDGDIKINPMTRIKIKDLIPEAKHASEYEPDPFSQREIDLFLVNCEQYRPKWLHYFALAFYTGLRTSEQYGLQWPDWRGGELDVRRAIVERKLKKPKTKSSIRTLQLNPMARDALKAQKKMTAFNVRIFWNPNTKGALIDYQISQTAFDYVCRKAGIRRRNQYQTRHTWASNMFSLGEDPLFIAKQLGHKNLQTLFAVYAKWIKDRKTAYVPRSNFGKRHEGQ